MRVVVNGRPTDLAEGATVADVVAALGHDPSRPGVAVAVDREVVRRPAWRSTTLHEDQEVEVLTAVQGGS
jgi:sulfur carrier protein